MQHNSHLNVTRLEHESKIEVLEKASAKLQAKKTYFNWEVVYYQSLNYPIHSNPSKYFLVKRKNNLRIS